MFAAISLASRIWGPHGNCSGIISGKVEEGDTLAQHVFTSSLKVQSARTFLVSPTTNHPNHQGFPGGSAGKESPCNAEDLALIPGLGRSPGGGHGNPLQYSCLENLHGQRNLEGCRSWGGKESDTTERHSTTTPLQLASPKHFFFWPKTPGNMSLFTSPSCLGHRAQVTLKTVYRRRILRVLWI